jgi:hypothetical protein
MAEPERLPEPEPSGQLVPPPRKPPTAIGLREPGRARSPQGPPIPRRLSRMAIAARYMLGAFLVVGGAGLAYMSLVGVFAGGAAMIAGARVIGRTIARAA